MTRRRARVHRPGHLRRPHRPAGRSSDVFDDAEHPLGAHIDLAAEAELLCVAPATANFLAKAAHGLADDLLSTLLSLLHRPGAARAGHELRDVGKAGRPAQRRRNCATTAFISSIPRKAG